MLCVPRDAHKWTDTRGTPPLQHTMTQSRHRQSWLTCLCTQTGGGMEAADATARGR
jgi:hypothetical protein